MIYNFEMPVTIDQIETLNVGDQVYLSGMICSGRDQVHKRILEYQESGNTLPERFLSTDNCALYHMGPIVKEDPVLGYQFMAGGPTTSARMNPYQDAVCRALNLRFVIGKGGMHGVDWGAIDAVYLAYPGGAGAIVTKFIKRIDGVEWLDFGPPEAAWFLEVEQFGPLLVAIDTHGNSLYE